MNAAKRYTDGAIPSWATSFGGRYVRRTMFDSHAHLDLPAFDHDRDAVLARAAQAGVRRVLIPAVRPSTWATLQHVAQSGNGPELLIAIGVHPQVVPDLSADERAMATDPDRLAQAARSAGAVAIGECGVDGGTPDPDEQERVFRAHVRAARAAGLPLVVHVLKAHDRALRVLREERACDVGGVLHSYSGGAQMVPVYAALRLSFSFAGPIAYPGARRPVEAARVVPDELLLAETDAPDQAPPPHRGTRCEPAHVRDVVRALAAARAMEPDAVAALTCSNADRLFGRA